MPSPLERINFGQIKRRFDAYWQREVPGRPLVGISAPRDDRQEPDFPVPDTVEGRWLDVDYQVNRAVWRTGSTAYVGEALPMFMPNLGPDSFAAFLGAELQFLDDGTSWVKPCVEDLTGYAPTFDQENRWWRKMRDLVDAVCEAARGRFLVGIPDLHGGGDALAAIRHPDRLALDLYDSPGEVKRIMRALTDIYRQVFDEYVGRISRVQDGCITWITAYSRGSFTALQNDFSGLISPDMFVEFFLDDIRRLAEYLDHSIYHLDGPIALGNLPHLLELEALDGIQWVPGAGGGRMSEWVDVCRRVLDAGKCLFIGCPPEELEYLLEELPHEGLYVGTGCPTEQEAQKLLARVEARFGTAA
ncbi:MAG: hypothetical protein PVJ27_10720 [Candidatus Brocadiaceae bacterium]|jgi:hypothetical protein